MNVFREALVGAGITNGIQLARRMGSPAVILFFAEGRLPVPYAELRYWDEKGHEQRSPHLPRHPTTMSMPAMRKKTVEEAQEKAMTALGLTEWSRGPFSNCWLPTEYLQAARERYMDSEQRT